MMRSLPAIGLVVLVLGGLAACSESPEERRDAYCARLEADRDQISRVASQGGAGGFVRALPVLDGLAERAPGDIKDEWQVLLNALHGLDDALAETGLEPSDVGEKLPTTLTEDQRRRVSGAASVLASVEVRAATSGIEQHALDICGIPLL
jgi:hypothetical protein